jgi:hypothetical protein
MHNNRGEREMALQIKKATKRESKARLALCGPSGSGKTWTGLLIATGLAGDGGKIVVIDTERGSASKYSDTFQFDVIELDEFSPQTYIEAIRLAEAQGYDVVVIDSLSHAWAGKGGALEMVDEASRRSRSGNSFTVWRDVTPWHNKLIDAMIGARLHVIATMRTKTEWVLQEDERGKKTPKKIGMAAIQRDGMEYEFDVVGDLDLDHTLVISKSRCPALDEKVIKKPNGEVTNALREWLAGEAVTEEPAKPAAAPPAQQKPPASTETEKPGPWVRIKLALQRIYPDTLYNGDQRKRILTGYAPWTEKGGSANELNQLAEHLEGVAAAYESLRALCSEHNPPDVSAKTLDTNTHQFLGEMLTKTGRQSLLNGDAAEIELWRNDLSAVLSAPGEQEKVDF